MKVDELKSKPRSIVLINPPVAVVDRVQLDYYADARPFGLYQIASWLESMGHRVALADMMGYGKHQQSWDELIESEELAPIYPFPSGNPDVKMQVWRYGKSIEWLDRWFDDHGEDPKEIWLTCSILFNAFLAHRVIRHLKRHFPAARIRIGGGYASLSPEHAKRSGADDVYTGRIYEADRVQPGAHMTPQGDNYMLFRLTSGCPNECAFCINGRERMYSFPIEEVIAYIQTSHRSTGIRHFNNWDPNVIRFRTHLKKFLKRIGELDADIRLRFDMGLEPDMIDEETIEALTSGKVEAFTIPLESASPDFAEFFAKPYTIISAIRALERLKQADFDLSQCHASYIIGYPDEDLLDVFTVYHIARHYNLISTPFPIAVLPNSPVFERYGHLMKDQPMRQYNGHLFPLIQDAAKIKIYKGLLLLLTASKREVSDHLIHRFPIEIQKDYIEGIIRARALSKAALASDEPDSVELLAEIYSSIA